MVGCWLVTEEVANGKPKRVVIEAHHLMMHVFEAHFDC